MRNQRATRLRPPRFAVPGALAATALLFLLAAGCEGPQGPQGVGIDQLDSTPPTVKLVQPLRSDTVYVDTFSVAATASDNDSVDHVEFFLDGSNTMNGTAASITQPPYTFTWSFSQLGRGYGVFPLIARAVDRSDNVTDTAPVLITHLPLPATQILYYDGIGTESYMTLPDGFSDRYFNVRFTPLAPCTLLEVRFDFLNPDSAQNSDGTALAGGCDFNVFAWNSNPIKLPDWPPVDSVFVPFDSVRFDDWTVVDVSADQVTFDSDFHAGFSPPSADYNSLFNSLLGLPIRINYDPTPLSVAGNHRSGEFEFGDQGRGWGTLQQQWNNQKRDLHIRVLVGYADGTTALLAPADDPVSVPPAQTGRTK